MKTAYLQTATGQWAAASISDDSMPDDMSDWAQAAAATHLLLPGSFTVVTGDDQNDPRTGDMLVEPESEP